MSFDAVEAARYQQNIPHRKPNRGDKQKCADCGKFIPVARIKQNPVWCDRCRKDQ